MFKNNIKRSLFCLFAAIFLILPAVSCFAENPPSVVWQKVSNSGGNDSGCGIAVDDTGNVYVTGCWWHGHNSEYYTTKYDSCGNEVWSNVYGTNGEPDISYGIAVDDTGNVYITGHSYGGCLTIKYDADGNTIWKKKENNSMMLGGHDIAVDSAGNVYVTGIPCYATYKYLTVKYDSNGNTIWQKVFDGVNFNGGHGIEVDDTGNIYVTGYCIGIYSATYDYLTIKYDTNGNTIWQRFYNGGNGDFGRDIAVDPIGNVYVAGYSSNGSDTDYLTIKYDADGNSLWQRVYSDGNINSASGIAVDSSGNVYVTGSSFSTTYNYLTIKYDTNGNSLWVKTYDSGNYDVGSGITVDDKGSVYVIGSSFNGSNNDYLTIKYSQTPDTSTAHKFRITSSPFSIPVNNASSAVSVQAQTETGALDLSFNSTVSLAASSLCRQFSPDGITWTLSGCDTYITLVSGAGQFYYKDSQSGNPVVTVSRSGFSSDTQVETINATGASENPPNLIWQKAYNSGGGDYGFSVSADDTGNVYVTGYSSGANADYVTIKYDTNGDTAWKKTYNGGSNDYGYGIANDPGGNAYVTGWSYNGSNNDCLTFKYNSNGDIVWQKSFDGKNGGTGDAGRAVTVDSGNNVYVAGQYYNGANDDCLLIKYDADGNTVWQKTYNGGSNDYGYGVTLDGVGNIYVAGWSSNGANYDYLIIKYNSSGDTVWQKKYDRGYDDDGYSVAVDQSGNVFVTGQSYNGVNWDYLLIKCNSNGDTVWQRMYDRGNDDFSFATAVDTGGNVYIAGRSYNGSRYDCITIKYGTDGNTLWQKTYNGGSNDYGYGIAVNSGNVFVTGQTQNASWDLLTLKYSQDTGVSDIIPPVTSIVIDLPRSVVNGETYISLLTPISFNAVDAGSGVASTRYRVDTGTWKTYVAPFFTLSGEGISIDTAVHTICYFSVDNAGNTEPLASALSPDTGVVGLWHMDESSGSIIANAAGAAHTGLATGTVIVDGVSGKARGFNGTVSDYITCGNSQALNLSSYTLSAWVYPYGISTEYAIVFLGNDGGDGTKYNYYMQVAAPGNMYAASCFSGVQGPNGWVGTVTANQWHHIAYTYNSSTGMGYGYVDGMRYTLPYNNPATGSNNVGIWDFQIGRGYNHATGYRNFYGMIDEVCVSNIARTETEMLAAARKKNFTDVRIINPAVKLKITSSAFNIAAGSVSPAITLEARDNNNVKDVSFNSSVMLSSSSAGGKFSLSASSWVDVNTVTFTAGSLTVYYKDSNAGNPVITAARSGLAWDTQVEVVAPLVSSGWPQIYNSGADDVGHYVAIDDTGNVHVTGYTNSGGNDDFLTIKYASDGSIVWQKTYGGTGNDVSYCVAVDDTGCVYMAGHYYNGSNWDCRLVKYDPAGNILMQKQYDNGYIDRGYGIALDPSGNIYVNVMLQNSVNYDYLTIKYDSGGNTVWQKRYDNGYDDYAYKVAVDPLSNVYVTGYSGNGANNDIVTVKYDSSGNTAWLRRYDSGRDDAGYNITVDETGDVYVTGSSNNGLNDDYFTIKYNSSGNTIWTRTYDGGNYDYPYGIEVDGSGNVYVGGQSQNISNYDFLTIKYDPAGDTIWVKRYDNGRDEGGTGLTLDNTGNVFVAGYMQNGSNADFLTMRYVQQTRMKIASSPFSVQAGTASSAVVIQAQTNTGAIDPSYCCSVILQSSSLNGKFSLSSTSWADVTSVRLASGTGTVYYKDSNAGNPVITVTNTELTSDSQTETVSSSDTVPPYSSIGLNGPYSVISGETYVETSTLFEIARGDLSSGVAYTKYRIDSGTWKTYTIPFSLGGEGMTYDTAVHTVYCYSVDNAGNTEPVVVTVPSADQYTVGLWHMDEASGTSVLDVSSCANNGTATAAVSITSGMSDNARIFDSSTDYVVIPNNSTLQLSGSMTIEAWIYPAGYPSASGKIVDKGKDDLSVNNEYQFVIDPAGKINFDLHHGNNYTTCLGNTVLGLNKWYHVAGVYDKTAGTMCLYLNGVPDGTAQNTLSTNVLSYNLYIGRDEQYWSGAGGYREFTGIIDEVRIFNVARTAGDIGFDAQAHMVSVKFLAHGASKLKITSSPFSVPANNVSPMINMEAQDDSGVRDTSFNSSVMLSSSSAGGKFSLSASSWVDVNTVTFTAGSLTVYYKDSVPGNPVITASRVGLMPDSQEETVNFSDVSDTQSVISVNPAVLPADGADTAAVIVTIRNASGQPLSGRHVTLQTLRGPSFDSITQPLPTDANGQCTAILSSAYSGTTVIIAGCLDKTMVSPVISFIPVKFRFTSAPADMERGFASDTITVEVQDDTGNIITVFSRTALLASSSSTGRFSSDLAVWSGSNTAAITFSNGLARFFYKDGVTGNPVLTLLYSGVSPDSQTENITDTIPPMPPSNLIPTLASGLKIQLDWQISPSDDAANYLVFWDNGTGAINYDTPCSSVMHPSAEWTSDPVVREQEYKFALRAQDLAGNVEMNTNVVVAVTIPADTTIVRAVIKVPQAGKKVSGNRLTVMAEIINGEPSQIDNVRFEYRSSSNTAWLVIPPANSNHPNPDRSFPYFVHWDVSALAGGNYDIRAVATDLQDRSDTTAAYITVTVDHANPDIEEGENAQGNHEKKEKVEPGLDNKVKIGNVEGNNITEVTLYAGVLSDTTKLVVTKLDSSDVPPSDPGSGFVTCGEYREFRLENGQSLLLGETGADIVIPFTDDDNDGYVDGTGVAVKNLTVCYYKTTGWPHWEKVQTSIDEESKTCSFKTQHFSIYGIFGMTASSLSGLKVYPNPCKGYTKITFDGLTSGTTVMIYNIAGELVWQKADIAVATYDWLLVNSDGSGVASGVYIYLVTNAAGEKATGKMAVIR